MKNEQYHLISNSHLQSPPKRVTADNPSDGDADTDSAEEISSGDEDDR